MDSFSRVSGREANEGKEADVRQQPSGSLEPAEAGNGPIYGACKKPNPVRTVAQSARCWLTSGIQEGTTRSAEKRPRRRMQRDRLPERRSEGHQLGNHSTGERRFGSEMTL